LIKSHCMALRWFWTLGHVGMGIFMNRIKSWVYQDVYSWFWYADLKHLTLMVCIGCVFWVHKVGCSMSPWPCLDGFTT
jgi:hypothetical protein